MATGFLPLESVRVVDVTSSLAGPYCTEILAALGADVVKVEHPQRGDESRAWGPPFHEGSSVMFYAANLGKRSLALDLKRGHDLLLRLVDTAEVFLQSLHRSEPPASASTPTRSSASSGSATRRSKASRPRVSSGA